MALYPIQDTFVRGEISPRLHARASLDLYRAGLSKCANFITLPHGGIRKRGGTYFVAEAKIPAKKTRLIPFVFSADQAYALELGDLYMRIYAYGARVGTVELATPWTENDLADLQFEQSADVMWIVHESYYPRKLTRTAHTSWSLEIIEFEDGPFGTQNLDEAKTMTVSAVTGSITVTANFSAFTADMVGQLIRIDMEDYRNIVPWEPLSTMKPATPGSPADVTGQIRRYNGNVYVCSQAGSTEGEIKTGSTPPTHTVGKEWDGPNTNQPTGTDTDALVGVQWEYLHSGFGIARITGLSSATVVTATVLTRFPTELVSPADSYRWRFSAFEPNGQANAVTLFEERLTFGRKFSIFASKTGDFDSFRVGEKDDDALQFIQAGGGQANDIVWLADADGAMVIGTTGGVRALSGSGLDEALTPSSFKNRKSRSFGCAKIAPADAGSSFIYVTRSRKVIAELSRDSTGRFSSDDISQISEHIPKRGVISLAFQTDPDPTLWFPLDSGELGGLTHQPAQEVRGLHRHRVASALGAVSFARVESAIITPGQNGVDDLWLVVNRTFPSGTSSRYIEIMQAPLEYGELGDGFSVDCGLNYEGSAVNTVSGMIHLNGTLVDVLADGKVYKGLTVTGGQVTLPGGVTASKWTVGLPFAAEAASLELDVGGKDGSLVGRRKKVHKVILSVFETDTTGLEVSSFIKGRWEPVRIPTVVPSDGSANLYTGNVEVPIEDSWEGQGRFVIRHTNPTPCTIRAMTPVFDAEP